jgi:hypothetical protein
MGIHERNKLIKHCLCNVTFPIQAGGQVFKVDFMLDGFAEVAYKTDVDIGLEESCADFLQRDIKLLLSDMCLGNRAAGYLLVDGCCALEVAEGGRQPPS